jgi:hypothetical protein
MDWRWQRSDPQVVVDDAGVFDTRFHRQAAAAGALLVRLEFPAAGCYPACSSIWRTDLAAQMLEHVVGLIGGWVAVNRQSKPLRIALPPVGPGEGVVLTTVAGSEPIDTPVTARLGRAVSIPPGAALRIVPRDS